MAPRRAWKRQRDGEDKDEQHQPDNDDVRDRHLEEVPVHDMRRMIQVEDGC